MEERSRIPVGPPVNNPLPSYWHNPKSPLANVIEPETDEPVKPYDYAIIGSGISGTMIAYNLLLQHPNARVVMIEAREICSGATGRNGGHTKAASYRSYMQHVTELGKEEALKIARLEHENILQTHLLAQKLGIECESQLCDTVDVVYDQETFEFGKTAIQALREDAEPEEKARGGMAWYEIHEKGDGEEERCFVATAITNPAVKETESLAGTFRYLAGRVHAYRFTTGILQHCVQRGLQLCANTPVHAIKRSHHLPTSAKTSWDIFTQYNTITSTNFILATNGYTPYLLPDLQGSIVPMRGQITAQKPGMKTKLPSPLQTTYSFIYKTGYEYMIPRPLATGDQHIIIGGGLGRLLHTGATEYGTVDDSRLNPQLSSYLHHSLPGYFGADTWGEVDAREADNRVVQEWTGIMGATADGRPFVGPVPGKLGMWVAAGFNGHGMVLCLKAAEALVGMVGVGGVLGRPGWFPESFLITGKRVAKAGFQGRVDMVGRGD
ncbi:similar to FAD dependent oxidoreductase [Plenodomus lingam JN3]|uniref:Similar to FAD dependent oxidoreductase n=1 Tax=Leptosphaeria maculans (strain JN3 / isolate v23.1.3 / race Av1-4-5-6-7-8) TaxID=985895 RepID=E4ZQT8_LEPMJ|nr:similar to FAD dependent oxidoreductase [Plenodomus lingam JN3]CBX94093.1 similar to FAD dependent oxidoreductase [Plenodomus lingam JN3]